MDLIIPIFITHEGCPHQCLFCNQKSITGRQKPAPVESSSVVHTIRRWLKRSRSHKRVQVAFFGGSFSCLPEARQLRLLEAVSGYLQTGEVHSIRISTRPDCISKMVLDRLHTHGVRTVELGCQSMDDTVLNKNRRGHSSDQSEVASRLISQYGMELGIQLMVGLPGETTCSFVSGIKRLVTIRPDFVRLYPALVVDHTEMAAMFHRNEYTPLTMNKAIAMTRRGYELLLHEADIKVIRMGLQHTQTLEKSVIAGPYHQSFGELVLARSWFRRVRRLLSDCPKGKTMTLSISNRDMSLFLGPRKSNINRLKQLGLHEKFTLQARAELERGTLLYDFN